MDISSQISVGVLEELSQQNQLGTLRVEIPRKGCLETSLSKLFSVGLATTPTHDIESILVFGSSLWKHQTRETHRSRRKKYLLFGPEIERVWQDPYRMPNDIDFLILTNATHEDRTIDPVYKVWEMEYGPFPILQKEETMAVKLFPGEYGPRYYTEGLPVNIVYRSVDQMLEENRDTICQSAINYGLPLAGASTFEEVVRQSSLLREPEHQLHYSQSGGILNIDVLEKN